LEKYFSAPFVIIELRFEERRQIRDTFCLRILDIIHPPVNVFIGLFILDLLGTQFFFNAKVLSLRFLHLRKRCIVGQSSAVKLLAGSLLELLEDLVFVKDRLV
jgi:hypothetical protein